MSWIKGVSERNCTCCGKWHKWTPPEDAPRCWCGRQIKNITMRPQQVTRAKLEDIKRNTPPVPRSEPLVVRCENCHHWHTYIWAPGVTSMTCSCGRPMPREGWTPAQIALCKAEEALVSHIMAGCNDMEGSPYLGKGKYD